MQIFKKPILLLSLIVIAASAYILGWTKIFVVEKITIESADKKIVSDVLAKVTQTPAVVSIGQPLARVDRREIATRLREMLWIENIKLDRNLFTGELQIKIVPRNPIGKLVAKDSTNVETVGFLDQDLEYFYLPRQAVIRAINAGEWSELPEISFQDDDSEVRQDVADLLRVLQENALKVERVTAKDQLSISTKAVFNDRRLDITWGSVKELELKLEILQRLIELKANKYVKNVNLSNPVSPIVSR
jgi:cell division septal protein FtsQ